MKPLFTTYITYETPEHKWYKYEWLYLLVIYILIAYSVAYLLFIGRFLLGSLLYVICNAC